MTIEEYRAALSQLDDDRFQQFRSRFGGTKPDREACVQEFAYSSEPETWDRIIVYHLKHLGVTSLETEAEKMAKAARDTSEAARLSAQSASDSARIAGEALRRSWYAVAAALLSALATVATASWWWNGGR